MRRNASTRKVFVRIFAAHTRHILNEGKNVGFFVIKPKTNELLLDHLYILPKDQGLGIVSAVLTRIIAEAEQAGLPADVGALRESASNRFYKRHGFVLVERSQFDNYYVRYNTL